MKKSKTTTKKKFTTILALTVLFIAFSTLCSSTESYASEKEEGGWFGKIRTFVGSSEEVVMDERLSEIKIGEEIRRYYLHLPDGRRGDAPIPLIMAFHSGHGGGILLSEQSGLDALADKEGFAVVYPDATEQWHDGRARSSSDKDIELTKTLIKKLVKENNIDPARIYATGILNGGLFTLRLACDMAESFAAIAPLMASMPVDYTAKCRPAKRIPIMLINGTKSKIVPWKGGGVPFGSTFRPGGNVVSVAETVEFWREHNDCSAAAFTETLPDLDKTDGTRVDLARYKGCKEGSSLSHITIKNGGSTWPGSPQKPGLMRTTMMGVTCYDINASEMIWDFFKEYPAK